MKRLVKMVLICTLLLILFPKEASAAEVKYGTINDNITWTLEDNGLLTIR